MIQVVGIYYFVLRFYFIANKIIKKDKKNKVIKIAQ